LYKCERLKNPQGFGLNNPDPFFVKPHKFEKMKDFGSLHTLPKPKKVTVKEVNQVQTLHVNGEPSPCPFRNPFFIPPTIQGAPLQMSVPICSDSCHFFNYNGETAHFDCTQTFIDL